MSIKVLMADTIKAIPCFLVGALTGMMVQTVVKNDLFIWAIGLVLAILIFITYNLEEKA